MGGWCTGMTQRDGTGREVLAGVRIGNMCTPVAEIHFLILSLCMMLLKNL